MSTDLTRDVWELDSSDVGGNIWDPTVLFFTEQVAREDGGFDVEGYFEWRRTTDSGWGRERFEGVLEADGSFRTTGSELVEPTRGIITATYTARLSDDGSALLDGSWSEGLSGDFVATREIEGHGRAVIDFERLPGRVEPSDGQALSDAFEEIAGVTFAQLDGSPATIAEVGGAATAFIGEGDDTPRESRAEDVGRFFLTDDGALAGLSAGIALTLTEPASEIGGYLLDVDFDEEWALTAFDADGAVVDATTVAAGDPFTGEGMTSFFLLQTESGENGIARVEMAGARDEAGEFGFALDELRIERVDPGVGLGLEPEEARTIALLYEAGLDRDGSIDLGGLNFWIDGREAGLSQEEIAGEFLASPEFEAAFGAPETLDDRALVERLYENVLDRAGEPGGTDFWTGVLADGTSREAVLVAFAESPENLRGSPFVDDLAEVSAGEWAFLG